MKSVPAVAGAGGAVGAPSLLPPAPAAAPTVPAREIRAGGGA
ncbi:hypothetical protein [Streptomyces sp. NPDC007883]